MATETIRRAAPQAPTVRAPRARDDSPDERLDQLWRRHWAAPCRDTRNTLLTEYLPLVAQCVQRLPTHIRMHHETDDLHSSGVFGLMAAIDRFDPTSVTSCFSSYASVRIRGAIFDELRRMDWLPRATRRRVTAFSKAAETMTGMVGRTPERREVLASMGVGEPQARALGAALPSAQLLSLNAPRPSSDPDSSALEDRLVEDPEETPESSCVAAARRAALRSAFAGLTDRQRVVLGMHIEEGQTQAEIGEALGITNSRVSQLETRAIGVLRDRMRRDGWMPTAEAARSIPEG